MSRLRICLAVLATCFMMPGCSALGDIASMITGRSVQAENADALRGASLEVRVYAVVSAWSELQERAAALIETGGVSADLRDAIRRADEAGSPVMLELAGYAATGGDGPDATHADAPRLRAMVAEADSPVVFMGALLAIVAEELDGGAQ